MSALAAYNFLGRSGLQVSNICLGTMTFGQSLGFSGFTTPTQCDKKTAHAILTRYAELGGNFIDTANIYSGGQCEEIIGNWLQRLASKPIHLQAMITPRKKFLTGTEDVFLSLILKGFFSSWLRFTNRKQRDKFVIATKVRFKMDNANVNKVGLSRRHIIESCEESLSRLRTNYIDLYQIDEHQIIVKTHNWDSGVPLEETLRTLDDLMRCGKIRYFGMSNLCGWQMQKVASLTKSLGLNNVISLQQQYSLLCRQSEWEEFMVCREEGIGVVAWSPLKGGVLTGKFERNKTPDPQMSRIGYVNSIEGKVKGYQSTPDWGLYAEEENYWQLIETMRKIASSHGKTVAQVALRWLLQKDIVVSAICGATSVRQIEDNMGASSGWELSQDQMKVLDDVSPKYWYYPYNVIWKTDQAERFNPFLNKSRL